MTSQSPADVSRGRTGQSTSATTVGDSTAEPNTTGQRTTDRAPTGNPKTARAGSHTAISLRPRSRLALGLASIVGVLAFAWPLFVTPGSVLEHNASAPVLLAAVLACVMLVVIVALGDEGIDIKAVAMLGVLSAIGAVLRPLSAGSTGIEFVFFFIVLGGRVFGAAFGFALGSTTLFASALLTGGVGPWLPFQMIAASWLGMGAGMLPGRLRGRAELAVLAAYAAVGGFVYGQLMNLSFWPFTLGLETALSFDAAAGLPENLHRFAIFSLATSAGWDLVRALVLAAGVLLIGGPVLRALRRTARRAAFGHARTP